MIFSNLLDKIRGKDGNKKNSNRLPKDTYLKVSDFFREQNIKKEDVVIVCIGTNRAHTIDCLGPLVGSILKEDEDFNIPIYGTMIEPIHALNITQSITEIRNSYQNSIIIAVDAALSAEEEIGEIIVKDKPLLPGLGLDKKIEGVGEFSIKGCVGPKGIDVVEYYVDLSFISTMAYTIAKGIKEAFL